MWLLLSFYLVWTENFYVTILVKDFIKTFYHQNKIKTEKKAAYDVSKKVIQIVSLTLFKFSRSYSN